MKKRIILGIFLAQTLTFSCMNQLEKETYRIILEDPDQIQERAKLAREKTPIKITNGLVISRWASDSLAPDPVAMDIDDNGAVYLARTNRQKNSEFDIRGHRDWMTASIGLQSIDDKRAFLRETFAPEKSDKNTYLKDLNEDGSHDWKDLTVEKEEIWKVEDKDGDGIADRSTRIFNGFHDEVTDVTGGLLIRKKDAFISVGPDLWRLNNTHKKGLLENPTSISTGYGVHIGFGGHGMSGVVEGPDGKIYWQIGDIGANITAKDGKQYKFPNSGVIVRSNPDGSDFEVYASGLRNTHEFVFDQFGNLISSDNDGDHPGESERLVHVVEGSDAGWRSNWQYGKYTDPKNNLYKVWMDEKLFVPRWEGQAAYIIPPIRNFHNGPTGMLFNPGTALGKNWLNKFFLVEFVGDASRSHIWSFDLKPKGASFDFKSEVDVLSGILPTGIRFGPEGALYAADWVFGWDTKNFGRVWKIDVDEKNNDLSIERAKTKTLIQADYEKMHADQLYDHLFYTDLRVRQKAQMELASRGSSSVSVFQKAIDQKENQLARIHGIWGLGQLAKSNKETVSKSLNGLLADNDDEIKSQAAKIIGDQFIVGGENQLINLLNIQQPRAAFFAAQALGRNKVDAAVPALIKLIDANNDQDIYLRHAAVLALTRIGKEEAIASLSNSPSKALRTAAVLVLRRMASPKIAVFLNDSDEYIATEAARAINDDESIVPALPALAQTLSNQKFSSEALLRRAINACLRVGTSKEIDLLIQFAERSDISDVIRAEAIATLGSWADPSVMDRVDGRYRGKLDRNPQDVIAKIKTKIPTFLKNSNAEVLVATAKLLGELQIQDFRSEQTQLFVNHPMVKVRLAQLNSLYTLKDPNLSLLVQKGMDDSDKSVRALSLSYLDKVQLTQMELPMITNNIMEKGSLQEQQQLLQAIAKMPAKNTNELLADLIQKMIQSKLPAGVKLDLIEAVEANNSKELVAQLDALKTKGTLTDEYKEVLFGGNIQAGYNIFARNQTAQCVRCHNVNGENGGVGPSLKGIASKLTREQLLQAMIEPSARIAPGYGNVSIVLTDGQEVNGTLLLENDHEIQIKTNEAEPLKIAISRIKSRENSPSGMPPMGSLLSKREIRDVVEYLSSLKSK